MVRCDLIGADLLEGMLMAAVKGDLKRARKLQLTNLSTAFLAGANFEGAKTSRDFLEQADLRHANLRRGVLVGANLSRCDLTGCNLEGADLTEANLAGATLEGAILIGARLHATVLEGASLVGALLDDALNNGRQYSRDAEGAPDAGYGFHIGARPAPPVGRQRRALGSACRPLGG